MIYNVCIYPGGTKDSIAVKVFNPKMRKWTLKFESDLFLFVIMKTLYFPAGESVEKFP